MSSKAKWVRSLKRESYLTETSVDAPAASFFTKGFTESPLSWVWGGTNSKV